MQFKLVLCAVYPAMAKAWEEFCGDVEGVSVHNGSILDVECDAVISPANSFGFMDGGIDAIYVRHFGEELETRVREQIIEHHHGELLVGAADVVETHDERIPYLIVAPTMRVPMRLVDTINPYLAARAILLLLKYGAFRTGRDAGTPVRDRITTVAIPGLGTGVGQVGHATCARQMRKAIDDVMLDLTSPPRNWAEASERHQLLYTSRPKRLQ